MQGMEGLPYRQPDVQDDNLTRLWYELVACVSVEKHSHLVPGKIWLVSLQGDQGG